jgi:hypothetical protein
MLANIVLGGTCTSSSEWLLTAGLILNIRAGSRVLSLQQLLGPRAFSNS